MALNIAKEEEAKGCEASFPGDNITKVKLEDCERISRLIKKAGVPGGFVGYDKSGRLKLKGSYQNEDQVDLAYMTALTVVGTSSMDISPVTPRDLQEIKMIKTYMPQQTSSGKGEKYALLVGISKFGHGTKFFSPIATAVTDAESIKEYLKTQGFQEKNIRLITDSEATKENILAEMRGLAAKVNPNDSVVFYISTHGTPPDTYGKMGIIPFDMEDGFTKQDFNELTEEDKKHSNFQSLIKSENNENKIIDIIHKRIKALKKAVTFDDLQNFMSGIKTNKLVAILDTCYSGSALGALTYPVGGDQYVERDKNFVHSPSIANKSELIGSGKICKASGYDEKKILSNLYVKSNEQLSESTGSKGLNITETHPNDKAVNKAKESNKKVSKNNQYNYDELEKYRLFQQAFGGIKQQQGKTIITASSGDEEAQFNSSVAPTSIFTNYLIKGLNHSNGQILPAFDYAKIRTRKAVFDTLNGKKTQTPEMISTPDECINVDLSN